MNIVNAIKNNITIDITKYIASNHTNITLYPLFNNDVLLINNLQDSLKKYCLNREIKFINLKMNYQLKNLIFLSLTFDEIK